MLVRSVDVEKKQVELSFRSADASRNTQPSLKIGDLSEGQKVDAVVKKIEDYGLFIELKDSKLSGLCHKSEGCLLPSYLLSVLIFLQAIRQHGC